MTDKPLREVIARALMDVTALLPGNQDDREFPVLASDPDFDDLPRDHTEGTADDQITQEAVLKLADAAIAAIEASWWVLVPAEPTERMIIAAAEPYALSAEDTAEIWRAMLSARPRDAASTDTTTASPEPSQ